ncbi:MAG: GNAT family N-acetyltransferase [Anaeromyxobacteraceae bacterium]
MITTTMSTEARVLPLRAAYAVEEVHGRDAFERLRPEWDAAVSRGPADLPFTRHAFLSAWLEAFAPREPLLVLVARDVRGAAAGFAPFLEVRRPGASWLVAPANDHSNRFEWALGRDASGAAGALWAHLRDRLAWDALVLRDVRRDGPTSTLLEPLARADGHPTGRWASLDSPVVALGPGPGALEGRLDAKFRANLRRRARRLAERGALAVRRTDGEPGLAEALADFLEIEGSGWKGRGGTAVAADPRLVGFYVRLARDAAGAGALRIRTLTLDGRAIAVHLGLEHLGVRYLPKTGYDEALAALGPGQLLTGEVLAECEARGLASFDFLGPDMPWKREWSTGSVPHDWLYVYRPSWRGRAMHSVKHRLIPAAKRARRALGETIRWPSR